MKLQNSAKPHTLLRFPIFSVMFHRPFITRFIQDQTLFRMESMIEKKWSFQIWMFAVVVVIKILWSHDLALFFSFYAFLAIRKSCSASDGHNFAFKNTFPEYPKFGCLRYSVVSLATFHSLSCYAGSPVRSLTMAHDRELPAFAVHTWILGS